MVSTNSLIRITNSFLRQFGLELTNTRINTETAPMSAHNCGNTNDEFYWDRYVSKWEASDENRILKYLGNEWKNEEIFLSILEKYSSNSHDTLEIGCGGGRITSKAVNWFKHVSASDVSGEMLRKCRETICETNISYHKLDGFTLDEFRDDTFDCVFSHDVFVHFSSLQLYPYFSQIKRVLKKDGVAIISFYNFILYYDLFREMSISMNQQRMYPPHMRVHFITAEMLKAILNDLSMDLIELDERNFMIAVFRK